MALTAPTLCPRCDAPATIPDHCIQCALPLRQCGACRGVAGPFDRHCGFCGFELIRARRRAGAWRLWLIAALVPLLVGLGYGAWSTGLAAQLLRGRGPTLTPSASSPAGVLYQAPLLGFEYSLPAQWAEPVDFSRAIPPQVAVPFVFAAENGADLNPAAALGGDLVLDHPSAAVVSLGRPLPDPHVVTSQDPATVLTAQVAPLASSPPPGLVVDVVTPVHTLKVGGRRAAQVVLRFTTSSSVDFFEETLISAPAPGHAPLFRIEALIPASEWSHGGTQTVASLIDSVRFS